MAIINGTPGNDNSLLGGINLIGTTGDDDIFGFAGNDIMIGGLGDDFLIGGQGNDEMRGDDGNDFLDGGAGNDDLLGGAGDNILHGGDGDDDISATPFPGQAAGNNVLDGGAGNDRLDGNNGNDFLDGGAGNDRLDGGEGSDVLDGGAGNDFLTGRGGFNTLIGGEGNDTYSVPESADQNVIVEATNGGIDQIDARVSFILLANVENLELVFEKINGTGNALNNSIIGSDNTNIIRGLDGNDSLSGNLGNDILIGGNGADILTGGGGSDRLLGGAGGDRFRYLARNEGGIDTIADFVVKDDSIRISATGFGGGLKAGVAISAGQFRLGTVAADASDRFIYTNTGALFFDIDGAGGVTQFQIARLTGAPTLSAAAIVVI